MFDRKHEGLGDDDSKVYHEPLLEGGAGATTAMKSKVGIAVLVGVLVGVFIAGAIGAFFMFKTPSHVPSDPQALLFNAFETYVQASDVRTQLTVSGKTIAGFLPDERRDVSDAVGDLEHTVFQTTLDEVRRGDDFLMNYVFEITNVDAAEYVGVELRWMLGDLFFRIIDVKHELMPKELVDFIDRWVHVDIGAAQRQLASFFGSDNVDNEIDVSSYIHVSSRVLLELARETYMQFPFLSMQLVDETGGTATVDIETNEHAEDFVVRYVGEIYRVLLSEIDAVVVEKEAVGDVLVRDALLAYRSELVEKHGVQGEVLEQQMRDYYAQRYEETKDMVYQSDRVSDVRVLVMFDTQTGRFKNVQWVYTFADGVPRPPIVLSFEHYNIGDSIEKPGIFEELEDVVREYMQGFESKQIEIVDDGVVEGVPDGVDQDTDEDGDGLSFAQELEIGTSPYVADTDGDGLDDGKEFRLYLTDPLNSDTDGDGYMDGQEVAAGYSPLK